MAIRMHQGRVHGNIKNTGDTDGHHEASTGNNGQRRAMTEEQKEQRRAYQRDLRVRKKLERSNANCEIRYCPICGTNLAMVAAGMNAAAKLGSANKV